MKNIVVLLFAIMLLAACGSKDSGDPPVAKPSIDVTVSPETVTIGGSSTLSWSSENATLVTRNGVSVSASGTLLVSNIKKDTTFTFVAVAKNGEKLELKSTIYAVKPLMPIVTISANPMILLLGEESTITISTTNTTSVTVNGKALTTSSFKTGPLNNDSTFIVVATSPNGVASDTVTIKTDLKSSYLIQNHWYVSLLEGQNKDGIWVECYDKCMYSDTAYFRDNSHLNDGTIGKRIYAQYKECDPSKPHDLLFSGEWYFEANQTVLFMAGNHTSILKLTKDTLIVTNNAGVRVTYKSVKNK